MSPAKKPAPAESPDPGVDDLDFEAALGELEDLTRRVESGDLPLDEAVAAFERGSALSARCRDLLDAAEARVQVLLPDDETADFE